MRRHAALLVAVFTLLAGSGCATRAARPHIGVVDPERVLQESRWGQQRKEELIKVQAGMEMQLHEQCGDLEELARKAENGSAEDKERYETRLAQCRTLREGLQNALAARQEKAYRTIRQVLARAAQLAARKLGLSLVVERGGVLYSEPGLDITDEVIRIVDSTALGE